MSHYTDIFLLRLLGFCEDFEVLGEEGGEEIFERVEDAEVDVDFRCGGGG